MAIGFKSASATRFNSVASAKVTVGVAVGDLLVLGFALRSTLGNPVASVVDNLGNSFQHLGTSYSTSFCIDLWVVDTISFAGTSTITVTLNSTTALVVLIENLSGVLQEEADLEGQNGSGRTIDCNPNGQVFSDDAGLHFAVGMAVAGGVGTFSANKGTLRASAITTNGGSNNDIGGAVGDVTGNPGTTPSLSFTDSVSEEWATTFLSAFGGNPAFTIDLFFGRQAGPAPVVLVTKTVREFRLG